MNYVFYDFETSGLNYYFDQPIQLAAKLVDENFNVLDELNEKCRLRDGVIPSPIALLITKTNLLGHQLYLLVIIILILMKSF